ncbi:MAG: hypothetical protein VZS44_03090 [Bacilli bacterium]|nr:hypothetical protein [Bacilli bacterium]
MSIVKVTAEQLKKRKKRAKIAKIILLVLAVIITILYLILSIIYKGGRFTITLDPNFSTESGIIMYEQKDKRNITTRLYAKDIDFMDNISVKWINANIDNEKDGSHNGQNYIAHTFYLENDGNRTMNYWVECVIDDATRNVDEAIRIMVYLNGEQTIYAKKNLLTGKAEEGTKKFYSDEYAILDQRKNFKPKDIDKYTIVIYLEGDDPDCVDKLIGGEIKMHMNIREEHIEPKKKNNNK